MKHKLPLYLAATAATLSSCQEQKTVNEKPNVLVILLDDAGYNDFGFMKQGSENSKHRCSCQ